MSRHAYCKRYEAKRNLLIPEAIKTANKTAGPKPVLGDCEAWAVQWNRVFHDTMEILVRKKKLVVSPIVEGLL